LLKSIFNNLIEVPLEEADSPGFACNAHCPDQKHVIIQTGCQKTLQLLKDYDFVPLEVDTSEFIKSGGSVFCMKLMFF
jgi:N-dimethylarginine dimethylaminohydrolase